QTMLEASVHRLLEILPDLASRFEVLVVDDGSTDATCEVAYELSRGYPQVSVSRNAVSLGWAAAVAKQACQASGEFLMIHCGGAIEVDEMVSLWRMRHSIAASAAKTTPVGKTWRVDATSHRKSQSSLEGIQLTPLLDGLCLHARAPKSNFLLLERKRL